MVVLITRIELEHVSEIALLQKPVAVQLRSGVLGEAREGGGERLVCDASSVGESGEAGRAGRHR